MNKHKEYQKALNELYKQRSERYNVFQKHKEWSKEIKEYDKVEELTSHSKNWESIKGYEEVYARGHDTVGNYHWSGVYSGHQVIKKTLEVEK